MSLENICVELVEHIAEVASFSALAALARTSRPFHKIVTPILYRRNLALFPAPQGNVDTPREFTLRPDPGKRPEEAPLEPGQQNSCIIWAASKGRLDTIRLAHEVYGASLEVEAWCPVENGSDRYGHVNALHIALNRRDLPLITYLLEKGVRTDTWATLRCPRCHKRPWLPLHVPMCHGDDDKMAELFIRHGADSVDCKGDVLCSVIENGRLRLLDILLELPWISPSAKSVDGGSALHSVVGHGVIYRITANWRNDSEGLSFQEAEDDRTALKLLNFGVPINFQCPYNRMSAFQTALVAGKYTLAKLLLKQGAKTTLELEGDENRSYWYRSLSCCPDPVTYKGHCARKAVILELADRGNNMKNLLVDEFWGIRNGVEGHHRRSVGYNRCHLKAVVRQSSGIDYRVAVRYKTH